MKGDDLHEAAAIAAAVKEKKKRNKEEKSQEAPKESLRGLKIFIIVCLFGLAGYFFWAGSVNS